MVINNFPVMKRGEQTKEARWIVGRMDRVTTIDQFKSLWRLFPGFKLENEGCRGWTALKCAISSGNLDLIEYIVQMGGEDLLNRQGAIFFAKDYKTAKFIIKLGASVNVLYANAKMTNLYTLTFAQNSKLRSQLIRLHLLHGGIAYPKPDPEKQKIIQDAFNKIFEETNASALLTAFYKNSFSAVATLPKELIKIIIIFGLNLARK